MPFFIFLMIGGLVLSQIASSASREKRLARGKRWYPPAPIIAVCFWACASVFATFIQLRNGLPQMSETERIGAYITMGVALLSLPWFVGYWMMQKWGVWGYTIYFIVLQGLLIVTAHWQPSAALIGPILFIYVGFANFPEMT